MTHTPEPWTAVPLFPQGSVGFSIKAAGKDYPIASCGAFSESHPAAHYTFDECEANGRLIAAAPDMLEALIEAHYYLCFHEDLSALFMQRIQAAIAQATGKAKDAQS